MEKTISKAKTAVRKSSQKQKISFAKREIVDFVLALGGFFIGRVIIFTDVNPINPLAAAYVSTFLHKENKYYVAAIFTLFGILTKISPAASLRYLVLMAVLAAVNLFFSKGGILRTELSRAVVCGIAMAFSGLALVFMGGGFVYQALMALLEGVLAFSFSLIISKSIGLTRSISRKTRLSNEEFISAALLICAFITGTAGISIGDVPILFFLSAFVIMLFAFRGGSAIGAATGMIIGVLLHLTGVVNLEFVVVMAFSGFCSGLFSDAHKLVALAVFASVSVIFMYVLSGKFVEISYLLSLGFSCALLAALPERFFNTLSATLKPSLDNNKIYMDKLKETISYRLDSVSRSFEKLSRTFDAATDTATAARDRLSSSDLTAIIDDVSAYACAACERRTACWNDNFYKTSKAALGALADFENGSAGKALDFDCVKQGAFLEALRKFFELRKTNFTWNKRLAESRELVSEQLKGVSGIISHLSYDLNLSVNFNEEAEKILMDAFSKQGFDIAGISVLENDDGQFEVTVSHRPCHGGKHCSKKLIPIINRTLRRRLKREDNECVITKSKSGPVCTIKLSEEREYRVSSGISRLIRDGSLESGDTAMSLEMRNGRHLLAISDGMGSGKMARDESETTLALLESLLESGFDTNTAIKMINSALLLKSADESFSTLDICIINLYTGEAEFIKIGAAPSFVLRGGDVATVSSHSLPVGILSNVEQEITKKRLKSGDVIIMASDGLAEPSANEWTMDHISWDQSAQDISDEITKEAKARNKGAVKDDITVITARVY